MLLRLRYCFLLGYFFCSTRTQSISAWTPPCAMRSTLDCGRPQ
ncbi:hypothetical protein ACFVYE_20165 [Streptomyces sp. NPDC058239]